MKRIQQRRANGRFQRNTLERFAGVQALVCAACRGLNLRELGTPMPEACAQCGAEPFVDAFTNETPRRGCLLRKQRGRRK